MNLSQILFLAILAAFLYYTYKVKSILVNRVIFLMLGAAGVFMILFPGVTSDMAHLVGVGRGTDLIMYLFMLNSLFLFVYVMSILKKLEQKITLIARNFAIDNVCEPGDIKHAKQR